MATSTGKRCWGHLTGRFTCHLPSWRGRGLSGDHPDLSFGRLVDDTLAYVDSIGEPTGLVGWSGGAGLVGWSGGAGLAVVAAARSYAVDALAPVEASGRYVPALLNFFQQQRESHGPTHEDPAVLGAISARVLVLV